MKIETHFKATDLQNRISEFENALNYVTDDKKFGASLYPTNMGIFNYEEFEGIRSVVVSYIIKRKKALKKEFDELK